MYNIIRDYGRRYLPIRFCLAVPNTEHHKLLNGCSVSELSIFNPISNHTHSSKIS